MTFKELNCEADVMLSSLVNVPTTFSFCRTLSIPNTGTLQIEVPFPLEFTYLFID